MKARHKGEAPAGDAARGFKGVAQGLSQRDSTGWLELCVHLAELQRAVLQCLGRVLGVLQ